ncbi:hypothetical protein GCM10009840_25180 [Pseudolysinimonas kribbensis]|uniref:Uncharacterized protein n=1 Tax=Pseudolysinimonas kribbensis TaxID=433641 RepID=A0ABQ6KBR5_9MICO|nr:hypothetical protein [Pseudolysinimonas kribbensis]GMA96699.1 hypothetical protein GCM10025881_35230 [Pseudolysinimonas kribbensis]
MLPIAAVLLFALAALSAGAGPALPDTPTAAGATVRLWVNNWGEAVSLTDPNRPGYAQIGPEQPSTTINALIDLRSNAPEPFTATLVDAQAVGGQQPAACVAETTPDPINCIFRLAVGSGVNALTLTVDRPGERPYVEQGWITGGVFRFSTGLEARDAAGSWQRIPDGGRFRLPATTLSSVRYVMRNVGDLPVQVHGSCRDGIVEPGDSIACSITGPRPVASLAAEYRRALMLRAPGVSTGWIQLRGSVVATGAAFRLTDPHAVVGQRTVIAAQGLTDRDLRGLVVRVGSRPVGLDTASTPQRLVFAMPLVRSGPATLTILEAGIAIARLPLTVSAHPAAPIGPAFPVALVVLVALGGAVLAVLLWRGTSVALRSRSRHQANSRTT